MGVAKRNNINFKELDYYPFGAEKPGRCFASGNYKYGYNGMEKDNEVKGSGNSYTTEFRQFDPRLARWFSIDPVIKFNESPYSWNTNNPILYADPTGADSLQRAKAVDQAKKYVDSNSGNTYEEGRKGSPGEKVDCSGMVSNCIEAGGETNPAARDGSSAAAVNKFKKDGGARRIAAMTNQITDYKKIEIGNAILLNNGSGTGSHIGIITEIELNDDGTFKTLKFIDSGGKPASGTSGPRVTEAYLDGKKKWWADHIDGFYKWDTKPDVKVKTADDIQSSNQGSNQTSIKEQSYYEYISKTVSGMTQEIIDWWNK